MKAWLPSKQFIFRQTSQSPPAGGSHSLSPQLIYSICRYTLMYLFRGLELEIRKRKAIGVFLKKIVCILYEVYFLLVLGIKGSASLFFC